MRLFSRAKKEQSSPDVPVRSTTQPDVTVRSTTQPGIEYWKDKGKQALKSGDGHAALQYVTNALEINLQDAEAWELKVGALNMLGRPDEEGGQALINAFHCRMGIKVIK
jgi:Flp pilus assembly protein TadD